MFRNHRLQIRYQKTDFNNSKVCQLDCIFKCCKCKKNNYIINHDVNSQLCLFCGTPNIIHKQNQNQNQNQS